MKKCLSEGKKTCQCGMLVCIKHYSNENCEHENVNLSDDEPEITPFIRKRKMKKHTDGDYNEKKLKTLGETPTK